MLKKRIHVAVGVVINHLGQVLIAKRAQHQHQGGLWEFPGGKVESDESVLQALQREFKEEVNIQITDAVPLIQISHDYPDKSVCLDVYEVLQFSGEAYGNEGQEIEWCPIGQLALREFPAANRPILAAIDLPRYIQITPDYYPDWLNDLRECLSRYQPKLLQLRCRNLDDTAYVSLVKQAAETCHEFNCKLMLNSPSEPAALEWSDGLHLSSVQMRQYTLRPITHEKWLSAACHSAEEIEIARTLDVDFIYLSPVKPTNSHPNAAVLGWPRFRQLASLANVPVYALGGLSVQDMRVAREQGACGIALLSNTWFVDDH